MRIILFYLIILFALFSCKNSDIKSKFLGKKVKKNYSNSDNLIFGSFRFKLNKNDSNLVATLQGINELNINSEEFIHCLGEVRYQNQLFLVYSRYYTVQAAIQKHPHNDIILINDEFAYFYDLQETENLPIELKNNIFLFIIKQDTLQLKLDFVDEKGIFFIE